MGWVRLGPLGTSATDGPIVRAPGGGGDGDDDDECVEQLVE
jgi:hypothetical protein